MMTTKRCCICKQEKPVAEFSRNKSSKDGHKNYCKACASDASRKYRKAHREEINKRKIESYNRSKAYAEEKTQRQLAEGKRVCSCCKIEKPMTEYYHRGNGGFYSQCKQCVIAGQKRYIYENHAIVIERHRQYHRTHKEQIDAYNKQYYKTHKEEIKQRVKDWNEANQERARENNIIGLHRRRSEKAGIKSDFTRGDWKRCKEYFSEDGVVRCAYCGKPLQRATIDHVVPFTLGGENTIHNIVPACLSCNSGKFDHPFEEWFRSQPFYSLDREEKIKQYLKA